MATADFWQCVCKVYNGRNVLKCPSCGHDPNTRQTQFTPCEDEGKLHYDIIDDCKARGWQYFHGSMAHKTRRTLGEPDFIVQCDGGRVIFAECKDRDNKPSDAQLAVHAHARKLGHTIHVVRSIEEWKAIANNNL